MKIKLKNTILSSIIALGFILSTPINAEFGLSSAKMAQIENSVNSMSSSELNDRMLVLQNEKYALQSQQESSQSPSVVKSISERVAEINAELSAIKRH